MEFLKIEGGWADPDTSGFEIVERKGLGHPDTLADGIAEAVSIAYSRHCLDEYGAILHHNLDKVFIGRGHFLCDFGFVEMLQPVEVVLNGRMSNTMNGSPINIELIQRSATEEYLQRALPHLDVASQVEIFPNASQRTQRAHWYTPRDLNDVPDATAPSANDTSLCVGHYPFSMCEQLASQLERSLWETNIDGGIRHHFPFIGQDVKIMVVRHGNQIDVTACIPILSTHVATWQQYEQRVHECQEHLSARATALVTGTSFTANVAVNPGPKGIRRYILGVGSCIECGEEGVVGRGNSMRGVISANRPHSVEAPFGKNPAYHTGRVHGYLAQRLAKSLHQILSVRCSVFVLTKAGQSLLPPFMVTVQADKVLDRAAVEEVVKREFLNVDYTKEVLAGPLTLHSW